MVLRRRHFVRSLLETLLPLVFICFFVYLRSLMGSLAPDAKQNHTIYDPVVLPQRFINRNYYIMYTPNNSVAENLTKEFVDIFGKQLVLNITAFDSEAALVSEAQRPEYDDDGGRNDVVGLVYENLKNERSLPPKLQYKIRDNFCCFNTDKKYPAFTFEGPSDGSKAYNESGFLTIQYAVEQAFISQLIGNRSLEGIRFQLQKFPYPSYYNLTALRMYMSFIPMVIIFGFILMCVFFVRRIVEEKDNRAKEMMRIMGLNDMVYFTSVFLNYFLVMFVILSLTSILFKIPVANSLSVINYSDGSLVWIILLLWATNALLFCMAITSFFHKPVIASIVAAVFWSLSYQLPANLMDPMGQADKYASFTSSQKLATCIFPNAALHWALRLISWYEATGKEGARWSNIGQIPDGDNFSISMVMLTMLGSAAMYIFIIWYVDNVWPWQFGIPKKPYYLFLPSYWSPSKSTTQNQTGFDNPLFNKTYFEDEPEGIEPGISVSRLTKDFGSGIAHKVAVNDLSLNMYKGHITALLGHNGAGKTTTMNIITGLFPPSSGSATVNGYSVVDQLKSARRSLGLCPQHNVLYDNLSVEEHLIFFAGLKGLTMKECKTQVNSCLDLLQLQNKKNDLAKTLSGGMKRKLSLGIAIIGDSEVLILDEPTAGMDPQARRAIWDLLHHIKHTRTIVLTTHYMEEADILGDRIAIMAEGVLQCCGSPLFLKKKFGAGYHLRVSKGDKFQEQALQEVVQRHVPSAYSDSELKTEVSYILPVDNSKSFVSMFEELEKEKGRLGFTACGLTITTMEDVFLRVGELSQAQEFPKDNEDISKSGATSVEVATVNDLAFQVPRESLLTGFALWAHQVRALLTKRLHDARRYIFFVIFLVILPFLILMGMLSTLNQLNAVISSNSLDPIPMDVGQVFGPSDAFYGKEGDDTEDLVKSYVDSLKKAQANPRLVPNPVMSLLNESEKDFLSYRKQFLVGGTINEVSLTAMYNDEAYHTSSMSLSIMNSAFLKYATNNSDASFVLTNHPLQNKKQNKDTEQASNLASGIMLAVFMPLALSFLSSSFILFPIHERSSKSKLIQLMTGVNGMTFWLTHFVWDFTMHFVASCFVLIPFVVNDKSNIYTVESGSLGTLFVLLMFFGWSAIPLSYLLSLITKTPSTGFAIATALNFVTGMIMTLALSMANIILMIQSKSTDIVQGVAWLFRLMPNFAMSWGATHIDNIARRNTFCDKADKTTLDANCGLPNLPDGPWRTCCPPGLCGSYCFQKRSFWGMDEDQCGRDFLLLFISGCLFFSALALLESNFMRFWYRMKSKEQTATSLPYLERQTSIVGEDSDVAEERRRVEQIFEHGESYQEALVVHNLTKYFGNINAVEHVTFSVHQDECFGLLGVNGAGKTTTFSMLTGDLIIGEGTAMIGHYSVKEDLKEFQKQIGYCPQFDALLDRLTGLEAMFLFARLRGVPEKMIGAISSSLIEMMDLQKHANKIASTYSGGNRRKLSMALSMIGSPPVVFLDEPTAGVDPASRRKIWSALIKIQQTGGTSFILTTHSMEECEALCGRLVIMVNGQFRCLGPIQYLKSKFGQGYTIIVKLDKEQHLDPQAARAVQEFFEHNFPGCVLKDVHQGMLHYHIVDTSISWSQLFRDMERAKQTFSLEDYLISDTTLEQIFLAFARTQRIVAAP